jgi:LysM domain
MVLYYSPVLFGELMSIFSTNFMFGKYSFASFFIFSCATAFAAMDPSFELDQKTLKQLSVPNTQTSKAVVKKKRISPVKTGSSKPFAGNVYTVRQGDNLFKILMREYALSNNEAEALIAEISRENNIYDIKKLKVGQKINIPHISHSADGTLKGLHAPISEFERAHPIAHGLRLEAPAASTTENLQAEHLKSIWRQLVPENGQQQKPLKFESTSFSLSLDPQLYPVFSAYDGARIILDKYSSIPPLVKSLITAKDPSVRIVSESPTNAKRLLAALLDSGAFYSVEPDFRLEFGADPKLLVQSDFKVEKNAESLIKQDVVLINSNFNAFPGTLSAFLKKEGFAVLEPFAHQPPLVSRTSMRQLLQVATDGQHATVDRLLDSLSIPFQINQNIDIFPAAKNGISLSVKVDRFFENSGKKHVVTSFDGDPITYTLFRILETTGYRVVILENKDDFRKVSEKVLLSLQIPVNYAKHKMWPEEDSSYSMQMSGFKIEGQNIPGGSLFVTDRPLDPIIRELLKENGYAVKDK